jgi:hypothetical protein
MVSFISERVFYQIITCDWYDVIFRKTHALSEEKFDDTVDNFGMEIGRKLHKFLSFTLKYF